MGWDTWLAVLHWANLALGCVLGVLGIRGLTTRFADSRWRNHRGGARAGRMMARAACLMSLFLIMMSITSLLRFPHWLEGVLAVTQFCCLGGSLWLIQAAQRIRTHDAR